jgi:hypothetical protein
VRSGFESDADVSVRKDVVNDDPEEGQPAGSEEEAAKGGGANQEGGARTVTNATPAAVAATATAGSSGVNSGINSGIAPPVKLISLGTRIREIGISLDPIPSPVRQSPANPVGAQDTKPKAIAEESDKKVTDTDEDDTQTSTTKDRVGKFTSNKEAFEDK